MSRTQQLQYMPVGDTDSFIVGPASRVYEEGERLMA